MRNCVLVIVLVLATVPAFAQDSSEEAILRELGMGALFADGNLFLGQLQRGNDPVQQLKRFFAEAKLPLKGSQERELNAVVEAQMKALQVSQENDAVRKANVEFTRRSNEILTADQRAELRRHRTEQIMMRGGFPALRLTLENAQASLTPEQETKAEAVYIELNRSVDQLARSTKGLPDRGELDKLENDALGKVIRLLTPAQRKALATSRQGSLLRK